MPGLYGALVVDQAVYGAVAYDHPAERGMNGATVDYIPVDLGMVCQLDAASAA